MAVKCNQAKSMTAVAQLPCLNVTCVHAAVHSAGMAQTTAVLALDPGRGGRRKQHTDW